MVVPGIVIYHITEYRQPTPWMTGAFVWMFGETYNTWNEKILSVPGRYDTHLHGIRRPGQEMEGKTSAPSPSLHTWSSRSAVGYYCRNCCAPGHHYQHWRCGSGHHSTILLLCPWTLTSSVPEQDRCCIGSALQMQRLNSRILVDSYCDLLRLPVLCITSKHIYSTSSSSLQH